MARISTTSGDYLEVVGAKELRREIGKAKDKLAKDGLKGAHKKAADVVVGLAIPKTPVGPTGRLAKSVKAMASQSSARVKSGSASRVPYAPPIHWGWPGRRIAPTMFLWDAKEEALQQGLIEDAYLGEVNKVLDGMRGRGASGAGARFLRGR